VKTQYYTASSLDGFIAGPNDSLDWLFPLGDVAETGYPSFIKEVGALAMGSATYEWMLRHVVSGPKAEPWPYQQPTWVFTSRKLPGVPGADVRFARGDVGPVHREMVAATRDCSTKSSCRSARSPSVPESRSCPAPSFSRRSASSRSDR
jgi:dihydrofolate reductase